VAAARLQLVSVTEKSDFVLSRDEACTVGLENKVVCSKDDKSYK